jgi:predicted DNA-binding WGR domain protein
MRHRPRSSFGPDQLALPLIPVAMHRVDPARNMRRFYSLEVERDLFDRVVLVRHWGRIGTAGKVRLDEYSAETAALAALQSLQARKIRRGYRSGRR